MVATTTLAYADGMERVRALQARERGDPRLNPDCASIVLEHGQRVRRSMVCMHGITSSPVQFRDLGALFHSRGYNVVIPRLPGHGFRDRLTHAPGKLTVAAYTAYVTEALEIGRGLGEHLTVMGLSVSGVLAAWCAQTRPDIDLAMPIAPSFAPHGVAPRLMPALTQVLRLLPNLFVPWDFRNPGPSKTPGCAYPRFSTHAMAESFRLGADVRHAAARQPPAAGSILVVRTAGDMAVNNAATQAVVQQWRKQASPKVREYTFGPELGKMHDIIGPYQPDARVDHVYPILFNLVDASA
jgi:pimeloyl-ACP methyl ester carboxylesterase